MFLFPETPDFLGVAQVRAGGGSLPQNFHNTMISMDIIPEQVVICGYNFRPMTKNRFLLVLFLVGGISVSGQGVVGGLTPGDAATGIREALSKGLITAVGNLNKTDGFFGNSLYKVLLPPDAQKIETTLRKIGMGAQVDQAILSINRGAERAVGFAAPIFGKAIREITLTDALGLIKGGNNSITQFFRNKTQQSLIEAFTPSVKSSLDSTQATKYYADLVNSYNKLPTTFKKINPDLTSYVVGKSVDALFDQISKEETNIRSNPAARGTDILQKVFGGN